VCLCIRAVRLLQVMSLDSSVVIWDGLVGDWRVGRVLYVNSASNKLTLFQSLFMLHITTVHSLLSQKETMKQIGVLIQE
jgi:hypothetical protein